MKEMPRTRRPEVTTEAQEAHSFQSNYYDIVDIKAWQVAYEAFKQCVGGDINREIGYSIAWTAAMCAVIAFYKEMNSRRNVGLDVAETER
jgi:hypothetical protein